MPTHSFPVLNQQFIVDTKYQFIREIGQGAYGVVWFVFCTPCNRRLSFFFFILLFSSAPSDSEPII